MNLQFSLFVCLFASLLGFLVAWIHLYTDFSSSQSDLSVNIQFSFLHSLFLQPFFQYYARRPFVQHFGLRSFVQHFGLWSFVRHLVLLPFVLHSVLPFSALRPFLLFFFQHFLFPISFLHSFLPSFFLDNIFSFLSTALHISFPNCDPGISCPPYIFLISFLSFVLRISFPCSVLLFSVLHLILPTSSPHSAPHVS